MAEKKKKTTTKKDDETKQTASKKNTSGSSSKKKTTKKVGSKKKNDASRASKKESSAKEERSDLIEKDIADIYENQDGSMPDMRHFEKKRRSRLVAFFVFLFSLGALSAVVWFGVDMLGAPSAFSQEDVVLSVSGQERVVAGQVVTYRVRYGNNESVPLARAVLQVRYPAGFVFDQASIDPTAGNNDTWELGALDERQNGFIDITGRMYGNIGEAQSFRAFLNYYPGNFSSEFQTVATARVEIDAAPVSLIIDGPDEVAPGVNTTLTFTIEKQEDALADIGHLEIVMAETAGFNKRDSEPESREFEAFTWSVDEFEESFQVVVSGSFSAEEEETQKVVRAEVVGWTDASRSGEGYILGAGEHTIQLIQTDVALDTVVNGAHSAFRVQPGDMLSTSIVIKNTGDTSVADVRARLIYEAPSYNRRSILHWNELDDVRDGSVVGEQIDETTRRGIITWTSAQVANFSELEPGEEVIIDVHLPIRTADIIDLAQFESFLMNIQSELQYDADGEQHVVSSDPIEITINSDLAVDVRDDVSESDGVERHTVTWFLTNSFHDLTDITLTADIYGDIEWHPDALVVPAGSADFDAETQTLTWTIPEMPRALDVSALQFAFDLKNNNPSQTNLTSKVTIKATDTVTGEEIFLLGQEILLSSEE